MKKFYFLLTFFFLASSCSTVEENTEDENNPILVTKKIEDGKTFTFNYNGAKITQMTAPDFIRKYTYTEDLITKYVDSFNDGTTMTTTMTYNSSHKITKRLSVIESGPTYTTDFAYIGADKVRIIKKYQETSSTKTCTIDALLNTDGSLKSWTEAVVEVQGTVTTNGTGTLKTIEYDGGSFPFKNITGYSRLLLETEDMNASIRNTKSFSHIIEYPSASGYEYTVFKSIYEYNTNGYPKKDTRDYYDPNGTPTDTKITTYEYNRL